ncbi:class I SAM-dependent methyltransferase [Myxococcota bacterium]|nr:class I SAM-dependent methyltransferase [Myxococcota bacterium]
MNEPAATGQTPSRGPENSEEIEHVACMLCGARDTEPVLRGQDLRRGVPGGFQVVRCRGCDLSYINPRPTPASIARYYPSDYAPHQPGRPSTAERFYYRWFRDPGLPAGSRILDVGCGGGRYLLFLEEQGYRVAGVEPNAATAATLRETFDLDVHTGQIQDANHPDASFDAVTFWWVLEHTHDPLAALREAHRIVRPGGLVVVALQNFDSLARHLFGAHWHHVDIPGHLYQFTPRTLTKTLERAGLEISRVRQDPIAKDFAPSLGYRLGLDRSLDWAVPNLLALPFDLLAWGARRSGLMTAFARRPAQD